MESSSPAKGRRGGQGGWGSARSFGGGRFSGGDGSSEAVKELIRHLLGRRINQPRAKLRHLAADLRFYCEFQQSLIGAYFFKRDISAALGKAHGPPVTFTGDCVGSWRLDVFQLHLAAEFRRHRADLDRYLGFKRVISGFGHAFAAGNRGLQHFGVVQRVPDALAGRGDAALAVHFHWVISCFPPN